jgi:hypothetical protein
MSEERLRLVAASGLTVGALLGMAGTFAPTPALRALAWGIDGTGIIVACALLAVHYLRRGDVQLSAGFLVFLVAETLVTSGVAVEPSVFSPVFAPGAGLWAAALALISASPALPVFVRATGAIAAMLFAATAVMIFTGGALHPMSKPLPFYAFPFLAATLLGWAWAQLRPALAPPLPSSVDGN